MPPPITALLILLLLPLPSRSLTPDGLALLALKSAILFDPTLTLSTWTPSDPTPCTWPRILCSQNRVVSLSLCNLDLSGYIPSELRLLTALSHLDLSSNSFSGPLPSFLPELPNLSGTLNLSFNAFSGGVPPSYGRFPVMVSLDLSYNNLSGRIPLVGSLINQGPTAFGGNPNLCGFPLENSYPEAQDPNSPPRNENEPENPKGSSFQSSRGGNDAVRKKNGSSPFTSFVLAIVMGVSVIGAIVWGSICVVRKRKMGESKLGKIKDCSDYNFKVDAERGGGIDEVETEGQNGKYVVMDEGFRMEMEELLRASAYVVGKSRSGIVYKVVVLGGGMAAGEVVAVRRLSEGDVKWRFKEFEAEVEAIGRAVHPNIVRMRAYYYADDEKLLVMEFVKNGSLHSALHGN